MGHPEDERRSGWFLGSMLDMAAVEVLPVAGGQTPLATRWHHAALRRLPETPEHGGYVWRCGAPGQRGRRRGQRPVPVTVAGSDVATPAYQADDACIREAASAP